MSAKRALIGALLLLLPACQQAGAAARESQVLAPAASQPAREAPGRRVAIFSGGCFWGIEAVFSHLKGVTSAVTGYQGGTRATARYETVSGGNTGHAESVRVTYDPAQIRYDQLLQVFFSVGADPTQLNRQGPDSGTQYRSALVPLDAEQRRVAEAYLRQLGAAHLWQGPIVTRIEPDKGFFPAEAYHQDYAVKHPYQPYIAFNDAPKVENLKKTFPDVWRDQPVLVQQAEKTN